MKTKTIIEELTQEDLVNLLCTATYDSDWLSCYAPDRDFVENLPDTCREDIWAKCLLSGRKIEFTDYNADEGEYYGTLEHYTDEGGHTTYIVSLQDIINGLQKCADGTFTDANNDKAYLLTCFNTFKEDDGGMDNPQAEALMQIILFGELIYG